MSTRCRVLLLVFFLGLQTQLSLSSSSTTDSTEEVNFEEVEKSLLQVMNDSKSFWPGWTDLRFSEGFQWNTSLLSLANCSAIFCLFLSLGFVIKRKHENHKQNQNQNEQRKLGNQLLIYQLTVNNTTMQSAMHLIIYHQLTMATTHLLLCALPGIQPALTGGIRWW